MAGKARAKIAGVEGGNRRPKYYKTKSDSIKIEPLLYFRKDSDYSASKSASASAETFSPSSLDFSLSAFL